jgi:hypothetical protein
MFDTSILRKYTRSLIVATVAMAYFVIFPGDLNVVLAPFQSLFTLTTAISPWLYMLCAVGVVCWTLTTLLKRPESS